MIHNDLGEPILLDIEPEGARFLLPGGEEVVVFDQFSTLPATVKLGKTGDGRLVISIWPGDGEVQVRKGGVDLLDLAQGRIALAP